MKSHLTLSQKFLILSGALLITSLLLFLDYEATNKWPSRTLATLAKATSENSTQYAAALKNYRTTDPASEQEVTRLVAEQQDRNAQWLVAFDAQEARKQFSSHWSTRLFELGLATLAVTWLSYSFPPHPRA
jgi:hypothetical protein